MNDKIYKKNTHFYYIKSKERVTDPSTLERIQSIKVPPAWTNVLYASSKKSHIQVHGTDCSGKKQYILSNDWIQRSTTLKYIRMKQFMKNLPTFKKKITLPTRIGNNIDKTSMIHLMFHLLMETHIRVGNEIYAEQNKTYGLTTLRQKHLVQKNGDFYLEFTGKSGIKHSIHVPSEYNTFLSYLKGSPEHKNKPLFMYNGTRIHSEELNNYLKEHMGKEYTCKDFRTYSSNILFIKSFLKKCKHSQNPKKVILESIDESAHLLGHTRNISKKSYISSRLLDYCLNSYDEASGSSSSTLVSKV
jgi:DNA topoisomerase-1